MPFTGVRFENNKECTICLIEDFSDEFKQEIRDTLTSIFHGAIEVEALPLYHTYQSTVIEFLKRYDTKDDNVKKGMIGELLAHILLNKYHVHLETLSVLKNKEERNIKKGFDIMYLHKGDNSLWYSEVKSGHCSPSRKDASIDPKKSNAGLLKRAKDGIIEMFDSKRDSLWDSALIDATLTMELGNLKNARELLSNNSPRLNGSSNIKRNVILITVLYHTVGDKIILKRLEKFQIKLNKEAVFEKSLLFSIQKSTLEKVENFLKSETATT